ncbi:MAG: hypothetical protein KME39_17565, partial [Candidatus Thiodiazotropha sp. (ex Ctena orbiculata)]|nr:hypothetical protein [Candidatus Thiodiazotropha taylori]
LSLGATLKNRNTRKLPKKWFPGISICAYAFQCYGAVIGELGFYRDRLHFRSCKIHCNTSISAFFLLSKVVLI